MEIDHLPGTDGVVRFPVERRAKPTLLLAEELAPRSDLADAMADERANGQRRGASRHPGPGGRCVHHPGRDVGVQHGGGRSAGASAGNERGAGRAGLQVGLLDRLHEQVRRTRSEWTTCALAARAAADAARGAREALDCHESGEPWRRMTGEESGLQLIEMKEALDARRRVREDEPA